MFGIVVYFPGIWNVVKLLFLAEVKDYRNENKTTNDTYQKNNNYPKYVYVHNVFYTLITIL